MAGDWIKIRSDIFDDAAVMQMSDLLGCDDTTMVGLLVRFWSWADRQTVDGHELKVTWKRIDQLVGRKGFAMAMLKCGWLAGEDGAVHLPKFERHHSQSAKARAMETEAKRIRRSLAMAPPGPAPAPPPAPAPAPCPTFVGQLSDAMSDQRREEKKREEKRESTMDHVAACPVKTMPADRRGMPAQDAATTATTAEAGNAALDFQKQAHALCDAYARKDHSAPAVRAAVECLRRYHGRIPYEEILSTTEAITEVVRCWPALERITYLPTAKRFFSDDQWRRPVESWASRSVAQKAMQRPVIDIGGRKPELFRFQETAP
jgi:hypothetical protein